MISNTKEEEFVMSILDYKENGYYVELGAFHSKNGSNTYTLENKLNWSGVAFDIVPEFSNEYNQNRSNPCITADALTFDYKEYFKQNDFPKQIDFLQVDVDSGYDKEGNSVGSPAQSLLALIALPLNEYRFSVITFEHDCLIEYKNTTVRDAQREILHHLGYKLVGRSFHEDWWVDPKVIPYTKFKEHWNINTL
jgi:hypothetical protein